MFGGAEESLHLSKDSSAETISEQKKSYDEICEMLVAAGYFRARISTLPAFDKMLGGLAWSLTASSAAVEVDLFYDEDMTLGQKIKLGENVVVALQRVRCPSQLQSHQIRGLDFQSMFPVFQWLVKQVLHTREERGAQIRRFSELQFQHADMGSTPTDDHNAQRAQDAIPLLKDLSETFAPRRQLRRVDVGELAPPAHVESVILEFGRATALSKADEEANKAKRSGGAGGAGGRRFSVKPEGDGGGNFGEIGEEDARIAERLKGMGAISKDAADGISGSKVVDFVGMQAGEIAEASEQYDAAVQAVSGDGTAGPGKAEERAHKREVAGLTRQLEAAKAAAGIEKENAISAAEESAILQAALNKKKDANDRILDEIQKLSELETPENKQDLQALLKLVKLNEALRAQEAAFKANCRRQLTELTEMLERLKERPLPEDEMDRLLRVEELYESELARLKKLRSLVAVKSQEVQLLRRKIDEVPTRTELVQYERRFVELYEQVSARLEETRRYYTLYNTLADTKKFLVKEISVLDSVYDNYPKAAMHDANKEKFVQSVEQICNGVADNVQKYQGKLEDLKGKKDGLTDQLNKLNDKQRSYFKAVKEFQDECTRNEQLLAKMQGA